MRNVGRTFILIPFIISVFTCKEGFALQLRSGRVRVPAHYDIEVSPGLSWPVFGQPGEYRVYFLRDKALPAALTVRDIFGASKKYYFRDPQQLSGLEIRTGIVTVPYANPRHLDILPEFCPRVTVKDGIFSAKAVYAGAKDPLNHIPTLQLVEPDIQTQPRQRRILSGFDGRNALRLKRVVIRSDYEDNRITDYAGPHPLTGQPGHIVKEGEGGFYANFHYAAVPFEERYLKLGRQEILNLAQGKLANIDREDLLPRLRVHALLPGPYLSKRTGYEMCEWGDTAHQAPEQELYYTGLNLWDWDLAGNHNPVDKILLIVWEGDEEDWLIAGKIIDPYYLTDDVVGVFVIERGETLDGLELENESGDFEIEVRTYE